MTKVCPQCAELRSTSSDRCPSCDAELLDVTAERVDAMLDERLRRRLAQWRADGLVDRFTYARLSETLPPAPATAPPKPEPVPVPEAPPAPKVTAEVSTETESESPESASARRRKQKAERAAKAEAEWARRRQAQRQPKPAEPPRSAKTAPPEAEVPPAAAVVGATKDAAGSVAGVDAFTSVDDRADEASTGLGSLLSEYVWWFIGALLVIGGSLMGVREAWLALGGTHRQLLVAAALFGYHAGFVGMAALVARTSPRSGRVLSAVAIGLLPVVFVALAATTRLAPMTGVLCSAIAVAATAWTLSVTARRFTELQGGELSGALIPALCAQVALAAWPHDSWARALTPLVGSASVAWVLRQRFVTQPMAPPAGALLMTALYGALAVCALAVLGTPDGGVGTQGLDLLQPGTVRFVGLLAFAVSTLAAFARAASAPTVTEASPGPALVVELLSLGSLAALSLVTASGLWGPSTASTPMVEVALTLLTAGIAGLLLEAAQRRAGWLHVAVPVSAIAAASLVRLVMPFDIAWWLVGPALMVPALFAVSSSEAGPRRGAMTWWGVAMSVGATALALSADTSPTVPWPAVAIATIAAASSHWFAGPTRPALHLLGGAAVSTLALCLTARGAQGAQLLRAVEALAVITVVYRGLGARAFSTATRQSEQFCPLDDVALGTTVLAVALASLFGLQLGFPSSDASSPWADGARSAAPLVLASVLLAWAAARERSAVFSVPAVLLVGWAGLIAASPPRVAQTALALSLMSLVAAAAGWLLRPTAREPQSSPAQLLGIVPLPWPASPRRSFADAAAWWSLGATGVTALLLVSWLSNLVESDRTIAISAGLLAVITWLTHFVLQASEFPRLRGSVSTLGVAGGLVGLTAVVNRLGRPLPPEVVGRNLTLGVLALWGASQAMARWGPALGRRLGDEAAGARYHGVLLAGVGALGGVLLVDALLFGSPLTLYGALATPPLMYAGAALACALLGHTLNARWLHHVALGLTLCFAGVVATQHAVLGPALVSTLVQTSPPRTAWVPVGNEALCLARGLWDDACVLRSDQSLVGTMHGFALGVAVAVLAFAGLALALATLAARRRSDAESPMAWVLRWWVRAGAVLVVLIGWWVPDARPAVLVLAAGAVLAGRPPLRSPLVLSLGAWLMVVERATSTGIVFPWAGPALALVAVLDALTPLLVQSTSTTASRRVERVLLVLALSLAWAFAAFTPVTEPGVGWQVLAGGITGLGRFWVLSPIVAQTLALGALALGLCTLPVRARGASVLATGSTVVAGVAVALWLYARAVAQAIAADPMALAGAASVQPPTLAPSVVAALAVLATAAHALSRWQTTHDREPAAAGYRRGRDALFFAIGLWVVGLALVATPPSGDGLSLTLFALALSTATCAHAVWREQSTRHVYFVECAVVGAYALLRAQSATQVSPQTDAMVALVLGFVLVGVNVMAKRAGVAPVSEATRRTVIILPVVIALLLRGPATNAAALAAAGSSLLYGLLATVERSRPVGSLAAIAANVALLVWALAIGLDGIEIWLAPLGLLAMMLAHLFAGELDSGSRNSLRIVGGLLLYAPAGVKLTLQLAQADDGTDAVRFGALCLLGMLAGVALRVRAYLALGAFFITLDVVTNLLQASLRNHRVAFVILSATGLVIIGTMVLLTLRRDAIRAGLASMRRRWSTWD